MKKSNILIITLIIIVLFGSYFSYTRIKEKAECSFWNRENCDKSCSVDSDCAQSMCCDCMNKKEHCSTTKKLLGFEIIRKRLQCIQTICECINSQCISVE